MTEVIEMPQPCAACGAKYVCPDCGACAPAAGECPAPDCSVLSKEERFRKAYTHPETYMPGVWFQVSRKYRTVARLPEGKTPNEALAEVVSPPQRDWALRLAPRDAADQYLRVYAKSVQLSKEDFDRFRKTGGGTATETYGKSPFELANFRELELRVAALYAEWITIFPVVERYQRAVAERPATHDRESNPYGVTSLARHLAKKINFGHTPKDEWLANSVRDKVPFVWVTLSEEDQKRILRWLDTESRIREGFDTHFARLIRAAVVELLQRGPAGYDPSDEPLTKERLAEDE